MSLINGCSAADLAAVVGNRNDGGFGDGNDLWVFLLFLLVYGNGWGNNVGNGGSGYPAVQQGFDQASIMSGLQAIQTAIAASDMSVLQGFNNMSLQFANCCCENRLATANLGSTVAAESCATRQVVSDGFRDMLMSNFQNVQGLTNTINAGFAGIDNKLCQLELDAKNEKIADLQRQVEEANDNARFNALIAAFQQSQDRQTTALEQYLNPTAVPAYVVPNPNCCQQNGGCSGMCGY